LSCVYLFATDQVVFAAKNEHAENLGISRAAVALLGGSPFVFELLAQRSGTLFVVGPFLNDSLLVISSLFGGLLFVFQTVTFRGLLALLAVGPPPERAETRENHRDCGDERELHPAPLPLFDLFRFSRGAVSFGGAEPLFDA